MAGLFKGLGGQKKAPQKHLPVEAKAEAPAPAPADKPPPPVAVPKAPSKMSTALAGLDGPPKAAPGNANSGGLDSLTDIFAKEEDERDMFHREIGSWLEDVSAKSLLEDSREIARSMRRMPLRRNTGK